MLHNPEWERQQPDFSLTGLISWLETKPPYKSYTYWSGICCLNAQYFTETTGLQTRVGLDQVQVGDRFYALPKTFNDIAFGRRFYGLITWRTYGAALKRAKRALKQENAYAV